jgi:hypothetical protein
MKAWRTLQKGRGCNGGGSDAGMEDSDADAEDVKVGGASDAGARTWTLAMTGTPEAFKDKGSLWFMAHLLEVF